MSTAFQIRNERPIHVPLGTRGDPKYRKYILVWQVENPIGPWGICAACGTPHHLEAAHTGPVPGRGLKASDYTCIPLCNRCHRTDSDSYHNRVISEADWFEKRCIKIGELIERLLEGWRCKF